MIGLIFVIISGTLSYFIYDWLPIKIQIVRIILSLSLGYIFLHMLAFLFVNPLLFPYNRKIPLPPHSIFLTDGEGHKINARFIPNPKAQFTVIFSHGNNEDLTDKTTLINFLHQDNLQVFIYDYAGYGASTGKPTYQNILTTAEAAYQYVTKTLGIPDQNILLYGHSLGTTPSLVLAAQHPVHGLILESPYVNLFRVEMPGLFFSPHDNLETIKQVHCPILLLHGAKDRLIPAWHGRMLAKEATAPLTLVVLPNRGHNDIPYSEIQPHLKKFISNLAPPP